MAEPAVGGQMPQPGAFVTPQAGVKAFSDSTTYKGKTVGLPPLGPSMPMRDLTQANINRFFDPNTYRVTPDSRGLFHSASPGQKRSCDPPTHPATKARLGIEELLGKFKSAAELNGVEWSDILGELSTQASATATSIGDGDRSVADVEVVERKDEEGGRGVEDQAGQDEELRELEEAVVADLAKQQATEPAAASPSLSPRPLQFSPAATPPSQKVDQASSCGKASGVALPASAKASAEASAAPCGVTGSVAAGLSGDGAFTLDQLYDPQVDELVRSRFENMDETAIAKELSIAKFHPEFAEYCKQVNVEVDDDAEWEFGEQEPLEDLIGLNVWSICKQRFRDRLALGHVSTPPPPKAPPQVTPSPPASEVTPAPSPAAPHMTPLPAAGTPCPATTEACPAEATLPTPPGQAKDSQPPVKATASTPPSILRVTWAKDSQPPAPPPPQSTTPTTPEPKATSTAPTPEPKAPAKASAIAPSQLSEHVDSVAAGVALPNSVSNRSEYMAFLRAARNPKKMAKSLIPVFMSGDKLDLFRIWLEKGQDFAKVEVEVNRRNIQSTRAEAKDQCLSKTQLEARGYSAADIEDLIRRKTASGEYIEDANFPGRVDLRQYLVRAEVSSTAARTREDVQQVNSRTQATVPEALSLTEAGCDFSNDVPNIQSLTTELTGQQPPAVEQTGKGKGKAKARAKAKAKGRGKGAGGGDAAEEGDTPPPPDKIPEPLAKANQLKAKVLKEAEDARTMCVSIENLECAGELVRALTEHSASMTDLYRELNKHTVNGVNDLGIYQPLFDKACSLSAWYAKRKKVANSMKAAATEM